MKKTALILSIFLCVTQGILAQKKATYSELIRDAYTSYNEKNYKQSLKQYQAAFALDKTNKTSTDHYNAACSASLCNELKTSWKLLLLAMDYDYVSFYDIENNADLKNLRESPKWKNFTENQGIDLEMVAKKIKVIADRKIPVYDLVPFTRNNLWGYMLRGTKEIIIEPIFNEAQFYCVDADNYSREAYSLNFRFKNRPLYTKNGNTTLFYVNTYEDSQFDKVVIPGLKYEQFTPKADKQGLGFTEQLGTIVSYSSEYSDFQEIIFNNKIYAKVKYKGLYGIVDEEGKPYMPIFDFQYKSIRFVWENPTTKGVFVMDNFKDNKFSIVAATGEVLLDKLEGFKQTTTPHVTYKQNGKWGVYDILKKKVMIEAKYKESNDPSSAWDNSKHNIYYNFNNGGDSFFVDEQGVEYN